MQLNYTSKPDEISYLGRVFSFIKRNYWLYVIDIIIIALLIIPPYNWQETRVLILILVILFIRDIIILRYSYRYLGSFIAKGNEVTICILKGRKMSGEISTWMQDLEIEMKYKFGFPVLYINKESETIFKQYAVGTWSANKMQEFIDSFYDYKKEQNMWKIYKGQE